MSSTVDVNLMNRYSPKLSPYTKRLLISEGENQELSLLIRTEGDLNEEQRLQLSLLVIEIRAIAGDIVTVTAYLQAIPKLATLEFVNYIEASSPMYLEAAPSVP